MEYDLFRDRETIKAQFMKADILSEKSPLNALDGRIDIMWIGSVLHLFG